jgi:hypothetical protein
VLLFGTKFYFVAFHSLCQSASREDSALALAREAVIRPLTDRPELGVVYDLSAVPATISSQQNSGLSIEYYARDRLNLGPEFLPTVLNTLGDFYRLLIPATKPPKNNPC